MKKYTRTLMLILSLWLSGTSVNAQCANNANIYTFVYNGQSYEVVKENQTWINASACAVARGGILAEIDDAAEQNAIYTELSTNAGISVNNTVAPDGGGGSYIWIGGNDLAIEGNWVWDGDNNSVSTQFWSGTASGNPVGGLYNNWGNEPDDFSGQDALGLSLNGWPLGVASQWNDVDHTNSLYYIIEHPLVLCSTTSTINETACESYTSPSGQIWTASNTYMDTISNAAGCDSIITVDLTINTVDISVTVSGTTITSNATGATFQWIDCDNGNMPIAGATNQSFTPTSNGNYAAEIMQNGCLDTTLCENISTLEITEENQIVFASIYPNPSDGVVIIQSNANSDVSILITSSTGRIIDEVNSSVFNENVKYDLSSQPDGVYFIILSSAQGQEIKRLVKTSK